MTTVHASPYSGSWYPGDASELRELLDSVFDRSRQRTDPCLLPAPLAFVVPHAGIVYSGTVAAAVYRHLTQSEVERVVLLGFSHHGGPEGVAIPDLKSYVTPLGTVEVDYEAARQLPFPRVNEARVCDHSVEIQLPLLQRAAPGLRVVPLYVGPMPDSEREEAARALAMLAGPGTIFIASSDLTHYGRTFHYQPFPVDENTPGRLRNLDHDVMLAASSLDAAFFLESLRKTGSTVCGFAPVALLLSTLRQVQGEEIFQEILDYQTSGELTGDFRHCVSYGALGYFPVSSFELAANDQELLLESARATIYRYLETGVRTPVPPKVLSPALTRRAGVFVSLHEKGKLRGCVGCRTPGEPLAEEVPRMALAAALDDPRFPPLKPEEGRNLAIEVSVLTPVKRIREQIDFRLGEHGVYLESGWRRALLLPQVAHEGSWTARKFWDCLARKAGADMRIYEDPLTQLYVFRAQVFPA